MIYLILILVLVVLFWLLLPDKSENYSNVIRKYGEPDRIIHEDNKYFLVYGGRHEVMIIEGSLEQGQVVGTEKI